MEVSALFVKQKENLSLSNLIFGHFEPKLVTTKLVKKNLWYSQCKEALH